MICFMCYGNKSALYRLCTDSAQTASKTHLSQTGAEECSCDCMHNMHCVMGSSFQYPSNKNQKCTTAAQLLPSDMRTHPLVRGYCREGTDNIEQVPDKQINTRQWSRWSPLCLSCARTNLQYIWPNDCLKLSHRTNTRQTNKHTPVIRVEPFVFVMNKNQPAIPMAL